MLARYLFNHIVSRNCLFKYSYARTTCPYFPGKVSSWRIYLPNNRKSLFTRARIFRVRGKLFYNRSQWKQYAVVPGSFLFPPKEGICLPWHVVLCQIIIGRD